MEIEVTMRTIGDEAKLVTCSPVRVGG